MIETKEINVLIAERQSPGDRWKLVGTFDNGTIYESLTEALNAYFMACVDKPQAYRLEPMNSKLYAITNQQVEKQIKHYNIYGDPIN